MTFENRTVSVAVAWIRARIVLKIEAAVDVAILELADADGRDLPSFSAGSHIDVEIAQDMVRQYSLVNHPKDRERYVIAILRESNSRGGSIAIHDSFRVGQVIRISGPRNHFPLATDAKRSFLFAGGIGITPILCMAEHLAHVEGRFTMHYNARTAARAAFRQRIGESAFADSVQFHFDDGAPSQHLDLEAAVPTFHDGDHLYVCGPTGFIDAVLAAGSRKHFPSQNMHREYFVAPEITSQQGRSFQVRLASTGRTLDVPPDKTVVQVLADAGISIPVSCEQGICGTCVTRVLGGRPEHRDVYLTDDEHAKNDQFTPCCSRALSDLLVLDV